MAYGTLEHVFWEDADLQELGLEGRAVAAYLLTCRHSNSEGYYRLAVGYVCDDLRIDRRTALDYLAALDLKNFARFDPDSQVVFIRNAMRFRPPKGHPTITGALRRVTEVPPNPFRGLFYDAAWQWAPDFAAALRDAGWVPDAERVRAPSLFEEGPLPLPAPRALLDPPRQLSVASLRPDVNDEVIDKVLHAAAALSVQQSIARRETIRNAESVAKARLAKNADVWRPTVERWLGMFDGVSHSEMAAALVDGGTSRPHWRRATVA